MRLNESSPQDRRRIYQALRLRVVVDKHGQVRMSGVFFPEMYLLDILQGPPDWLAPRSEVPEGTSVVVTRDNTCDLVDDHDEVLLRVERMLRPDVDVPDHLVRPRVPRRNEDRVTFASLNSPNVAYASLQSRSVWPSSRTKSPIREHLVRTLHVRRLVKDSRSLLCPPLLSSAAQDERAPSAFAPFTTWDAPVAHATRNRRDGYGPVAAAARLVTS